MNAITKKGDDRTCTDGLRNRFFQRKRMLAEDFKIEQGYVIGRRRLVSRSVLGWGVVYGFAIEDAGKADRVCGEKYKPKAEQAAPAKEASGGVMAEQASAEAPSAPAQQAVQEATARGPEPASQPLVLKVGPGFVLDKGGREAVLFAAVELTANNTFLLVNADNVWSPPRLDEKMEHGKYVLAVHYAERKTGDTVVPSFCCSGDAERTHVCETALFSLRRLGECDCACAEDDCPGGEACVCDGCHGEQRSHARLVSWSTERDFGQVSELRRWDHFKVAFDDPVDLACVEIAKSPDKCKPIEVTWVDASSPRRVVKTNDSLFDLIRGCDLTRIEDVSWRDWHRNRDPVEWHDFASYFTAKEYRPDSLLTNFTVRFSGPVLTETVRRDTISITVQMVDGGTGWVRSRRIPISGLDPTPSVTTLPPGTTDQFTVAVARRWVRDEIDQGGESHLSERDFVVEIEVRGDLIEDCSGQTVDANTVGLRPSPTGNGTPGGSYFSSFKVKRSTRSVDEDNERTAS